MYSLLIDDYLDAPEMSNFLYSCGYELVNRKYTAVSTWITVEPMGDAMDIDEMMVRMSDHFYVGVELV